MPCHREARSDPENINNWIASFFAMTKQGESKEVEYVWIGSTFSNEKKYFFRRRIYDARLHATLYPQKALEAHLG